MSGLRTRKSYLVDGAVVAAALDVLLAVFVLVDDDLHVDERHEADDLPQVRVVEPAALDVPLRALHQQSVDVAALLGALRDLELVRYRVGPSIAAHTGPGTAGGFSYRI